MSDRETRFEMLDSLYPFTPMNPDERDAERDWLIDGLLLRGKINVMLGPEKSGKSRLLGFMLAAAFAKIDALWDCVVAPLGPTCYLLGEETRAEVVTRLRAYVKLLGGDYRTIRWSEMLWFVDASALRIDVPERRAWLLSRMKQRGITTLVLDPLRRIHGADEDSNTEMSRIFNDLRRWSNVEGLSVVMLHHTGKLPAEADETRIATWGRGATDLAAILDLALYAKRYSRQRRWWVKLMRAGRFPPLDPLRLLDGGDMFGFTRDDSED